MLQDKIAVVEAKIQEALANRKEPKATGDKVTILAVTKNHPADIVTETLAAGLTEIGENRVQEAMHKQAVLPLGQLASDRPSADQQGQACGGAFCPDRKRGQPEAAGPSGKGGG